MSGFVLDNSVTMRRCFDSGVHVYADRSLAQIETQRGPAYISVLYALADCIRPTRCRHSGPRLLVRDIARSYDVSHSMISRLAA